MAFYHVFLSGEHFLLEREGKEAWYGFYKNVYVEADTPDVAESYAIQRACTDPEFRASVRNPPDNPPALNIEETNVIEKDLSLADSPFAYVPE